MKSFKMKIQKLKCFFLKYVPRQIIFIYNDMPVLFIKKNNKQICVIHYYYVFNFTNCYRKQ